jgi:ABC-type spermidine/putrescine transport system permease subunit II
MKNVIPPVIIGLACLWYFENYRELCLRTILAFVIGCIVLRFFWSR